MNIEQLSEKFTPWMRVDTWHTIHPSDDKRFHKALSEVFKEFGVAITYDDFKDAMLYLVETIYSNKYEPEYLEKTIERYASNAEKISSYLFDNNIKH
jgi:hypothetical protein